MPELIGLWTQPLEQIVLMNLIPNCTVQNAVSEHLSNKDTWHVRDSHNPQLASLSLSINLAVILCKISISKGQWGGTGGEELQICFTLALCIMQWLQFPLYENNILQITVRQNTLKSA